MAASRKSLGLLALAPQKELLSSFGASHVGERSLAFQVLGRCSSGTGQLLAEEEAEHRQHRVEASFQELA